MRRLAFAVCIAAFAAFPSFGDEKPATADEKGLVEAASATKAKRKQSTSHVITNADVKKSKGKIGSTNAPATPVTPEPSLVEQYQASRAATAREDAARAEAREKVDVLQKELAAIEKSYFEEDDLDRRDHVIAATFADVKARLDAAREELARHSPPDEATPPAH
jgi:hypothetical protein